MSRRRDHGPPGGRSGRDLRGASVGFTGPGSQCPSMMKHPAQREHACERPASQATWQQPRAPYADFNRPGSAVGVGCSRGPALERSPELTGKPPAAMSQSKPARKAGKALAAVQVGQQFTISGGFSKKHYVIKTRNFDFGQGCVPCVQVHHREPWLCEMATDSPVYQRPMSRVRVLHALRAHFGELAEGHVLDEKMQDLAFEEDELDQELTPRTPVKGQAPRKRGVKCGTASAVAEQSQDPVARTVAMPSQPAAADCTVEVLVALADKKLWLALTCLPWLIQYVAAEKASGGVAPVVEVGEDRSNNSGIRWNFRDNTWQARCRRSDGTWATKTKTVHGRTTKATDALFNCDFEVAKKRVYQELEAWMLLERAAAGESPRG